MTKQECFHKLDEVTGAIRALEDAVKVADLWNEHWSSFGQYYLAHTRTLIDGTGDRGPGYSASKGLVDGGLADVLDRIVDVCDQEGIFPTAHAWLKESSNV
jgi:hypothetical protein